MSYNAKITKIVKIHLMVLLIENNLNRSAD
jgi:hypothetical protein